MKMLKMLFVLFCLLAYAWVFSIPCRRRFFSPCTLRTRRAQPPRTRYLSRRWSRRTSPLFADRQMTLKIADVPAGQQVTVLEKYTTNRSDRLLVLLVAYADKSGKEHTGWFYGTLRVRYPH